MDKTYNMKENNNIDNLFSEGLSGFEVAPSQQVWEGVEGALFPASKPVPFYRKRWALAVLLLLLLSVGAWLFFGVNSSKSRKSVEATNKQTPVVSKPSATPTATGNKNERVSNNSVHSAGQISAEKRVDNTLPPANAQQQIEMQFQKPKTESGLFKETDIIKKSLLEAIPSVDIHTLAVLPKNNPLNQPREIISVEQYIKRRNNLHFYTGAGVEVGMVYYPVSSDQITYAADVSFGLKVKKYYFETGVGYRYVQERGSYKINFITKDSVGYYNQVTSFEINPQYPDKIILNYKKTTVFDSIEHVAYTAPLFKYDYFTVPLKIGYRFFNRKKLFAALETGIEYNRLINAYIPESGFYYQGSDVINIVNTTSERVINNWKYLISIRVGIKLKNNICLIVQPEFSKYANSIYKVESGSGKTKPYMMNLRASIYYDF
jgi:hypothetical protein